MTTKPLEGDAAPMPRATDKQVRAAKKKAASAARVNEMVAEQTKPKRAGRRTTDPVITSAVPRETTPIYLEGSAEYAELESRHVILDTQIDKMTDEQVKALADKLGVKARAGISETVKAIKAQHPDDVEQAMAVLSAVPRETDDVPLVRPEAKPAYQGPMLALRSRLKAGVYTKAANGQPSCGDEVAQILGQLEPTEVIRACLIAMDLDHNPYAHLNVGQQSMNLRNKLRGMLKKGSFGMGVVREAAEEVIEGRQIKEDNA